MSEAWINRRSTLPAERRSALISGPKAEKSAVHLLTEIVSLKRIHYLRLDALAVAY
jgi:hypothetical protein